MAVSHATSSFAMNKAWTTENPVRASPLTANRKAQAVAAARPLVAKRRLRRGDTYCAAEADCQADSPGEGNEDGGQGQVIMRRLLDEIRERQRGAGQRCDGVDCRERQSGLDQTQGCHFAGQIASYRTLHQDFPFQSGRPGLEAERSRGVGTEMSCISLGNIQVPGGKVITKRNVTYSGRRSSISFISIVTSKI